MVVTHEGVAWLLLRAISVTPCSSNGCLAQLTTMLPSAMARGALLGRCRAPLGGPAAVAASHNTPQKRCTSRVCAPSTPPTSAASGQQRRRLARAAAAHREGEERGASAVGHDLGWEHVARDVRSRLMAVAGGKQSTMDQLQAW